MLQDAAQHRPAEGEEERSSSSSLYPSWQRLQQKFGRFGCNSQTKVCLSKKDYPRLVPRHLRTSQPWQPSQKTTNKLQFPPDVFVLLLPLLCCSAVDMFLFWSTRVFTMGVSPVSHSSGTEKWRLQEKSTQDGCSTEDNTVTPRRGWSVRKKNKTNIVFLKIKKTYFKSRENVLNGLLFRISFEIM